MAFTVSSLVLKQLFTLVSLRQGAADVVAERLGFLCGMIPVFSHAQIGRCNLGLRKRNPVSTVTRLPSRPESLPPWSGQDLWPAACPLERLFEARMAWVQDA
jgi:hypothetical protein